MSVESGEVHRPAKLTRWHPKRWEVLYDQWVALSTLGKSNKDIADHFGYSPQQVSNILNTPEASLIRRRMLEALRKGAELTIPKRLEHLADKAVQRLAEVLENDQLMERSPFAVVDRGLALLRGVGKIKSEGGGNVNNIGKALILSDEAARELTEGMSKANEARKLNPVEIEVDEVGEVKERRTA